MACTPRGRFVPAIRSKVHPLGDFRYILQKDASDVAFRSGDPRMDSATLKDYYNWSNDSYVLVYEEEGLITGVMRLKEYQNTPRSLDYVFVDMFAVRAGYAGLGRVMERMAVEVARQLQDSIISLCSLDTAVGFWVRCGYIQCDAPSASENWGMLTPMEKKLT